MEFFSAKAPWYLAGPGIGLVIIGLYWVANQPLGAVGAYVELSNQLKSPQRQIPWRVYFLGGLLIGGLLSSLLAGKFVPSVQLGAAWGGGLTLQLSMLLGGGVLMGLGARYAGGCTAGHAMCGTAVGNPASFVASGTFMATAIGVAHLLAWGLQ